MTMTESPSLIPDLSRITAVLSNELTEALRRHQPGGGTLPPFDCEDFSSSRWPNNTIRIWNVEERQSLVFQQCQRYFEAARTNGDSLVSLDHAFSSLIRTALSLKGSQSVDSVAEDAAKFLSRLPATPLQLPDASGDRFSGDTLQQVSTITKFLSTNVIRTALAWIIYDGGICHTFQDLTDMCAEQLEMVSKLKIESMSVAEKATWCLVRAFLWSSWQRLLMIYFHARFNVQQHGSFEHAHQYHLFTRGTFPAPGMSLSLLSDNISLSGRSPYMCTWAFESMRTQPACVIPDFRLFHLRFSQLFGNQSARCKISSAVPCDGWHSDDCQRFKGLKIRDQSKHDENCVGNCPRLVWDEQSYRSITGARAVSLAANDAGQHRLCYCSASNRTMAISHVWSHGHGGRPEEGINKCLHERFARIARSLGCDSYWMDTTCIPKDHRLRQEAIKTINTVFYQSAVTVVCDQDLMNIDVSDISSRGIKFYESILSAILVCDWNVRAWTFLESMKGRKNVRILCKSDMTLSVRETIRLVYAQGRIEICILCHLLSNFLPRQGDGFEVTRMNRWLNRTDEVRKEISGTLLSFRPASRPGDDIVIWSLLLGDDKIAFDPVTFWRSRVHTSIYTGFLVSSAPRCKENGLSWAPATPYAVSKPRMGRRPLRSYRAFDGFDTELANITHDGLFGPWFICDVDEDLRPSKALGPSQVAREIRKIRRSLFVPTLRFIALIQPIGTSQVAWQKSQLTARYRGRVDGTLLVIVGSNKDCVVVRRGQDAYKWKWKGLYEWPRDVPLPPFKKDHLCIA